MMGSPEPRPGSPKEKPEDTARREVGRLVTGGTIVCSYCNASDVTDDGHRRGCPVLPVLAALDELVAERDRLESLANIQHWRRAEAAEAQVAALTQTEEQVRACWDEEVNKRIAAEARVATLTTALEEIEAIDERDDSRPIFFGVQSALHRARDIARRALGDAQ